MKRQEIGELSRGAARDGVLCGTDACERTARRGAEVCMAQHGAARVVIPSALHVSRFRHASAYAEVPGFLSV
ncbi:hypothetical protein PSP6_640001 [Paraburkholderia tropica]|nr:hypothetical protein PSP6_640001 [Paraburkholderia tropica]